MARFVVRNFRKRSKLTLSRQHSDACAVTISLTLPGTRVVEIADSVVAKYCDSIADYVAEGALLPIPDAPEA